LKAVATSSSRISPCCTDLAAKAVPAQRRLTWALVDEHGGLLRHAPEDRGAE
jgi:hypothetical protein